MVRMGIRRIFLLAWFFASLGNTLGSGALANDTRVRIVSPIAGQQFAPGDKVSIVVKVAPSLGATDGSVGLAGLGSLKAKNFTGTGFTADFVIPDYYAGPLTLWPDGMAGGTYLVGPKVSISVRPRTPPKQLSVQDRYHFLSLSQANPTKIYAKGRYANGVERDLSSSVSGTTYTSSNASVVSVDREGVCTVIANGLAVITVENGGVRDFVAFVVDDPVHPSPPIDLSDKVTIRRGNLRLESNPRIVRSHYQRVTITNTTSLPLAGPLFLAVTGLPKGIIAYGGDGEGRHSLTLPDQGLGLLSAQSVTIDLGFLNQGKAPIEYTAKVYHGVPK
jgi:hypothetical protein